MKAPIKNKVKKQKLKKKPNDKSLKEQVLVVAQEFKFARLLSGNEKKTRDRVLKTLKKWLQNHFEKGYEFKEDDFIRVWKGLFYAVWMSDKPLVQEELCESIAEILDLFPPEQLEHAVLMTKTGLKVLATEWYGIDQHRMDKFLMLVRRYLRGSLRCLLRCDWSLQSCQVYSDMLMGNDGILCVKTPQYARNATSMILHFLDCFLEELAKVCQGYIPEDSVAALLLPFTSLVCGGETLMLCVAARRLLTVLLRQSDCGLQYQEATRAWQKMGCPTGGPEALELVSDEEVENGDAEEPMEEQASALDPRAGRVNVYLPLLPVPAALLADQLKKLMTKASSKAYKRARICLERFEAVSKNKYPLGVSEAEASGVESPEPAEEPQHAAHRLRKLEKTLVAQSDELALRGLKRKNRKRLLARSRAGLSIVEDAAQLADAPANSTNGDWQIEEEDTQRATSLKNKKDGSSNKENEVNKKKVNRKRKALEHTLDKIKTIKGNNVIKKSKVSNKSEFKTSDELEKNIDGSKNNSLVNGNTEKDRKIKIDKSPMIEKTTRQDRVVKNTPKLIETHKQLNKINNSEVKVVLPEKNKQKTEPSNVSKIISNDKKTISRQKVLPMGKIKNYQKQTFANGKMAKETSRKKVLDIPKKVKFVLKNNSMQEPIDYKKSVLQSPSIPFDSTKKPSKTNLKVSTPSPINPFFKKKLKMKF